MYKHTREFNLFSMSSVCVCVCVCVCARARARVCVCVAKNSVLIDLQSEANKISAKSRTLSIPDESLLPHQATF